MSMKAPVVPLKRRTLWLRGYLRKAGTEGEVQVDSVRPSRSTKGSGGPIETINGPPWLTT